MLNIVLFEPEIPANTGNIGRTCVATNTRLHLIEPLGFRLDEKSLKRAGMDYWQYIDLNIYENWEDFLAKNPQDIKLYFFTTKTERSFWECPYEEDAYLVFGSESKGLNEYLYQKYEDNQYTIPMTGKFHRSLNLACSAGIVLYEGLRRFKK